MTPLSPVARLVLAALFSQFAAEQCARRVVTSKRELTMRFAIVVAALACVAGPALAQPNDNAVLNELQAAPEPAQQKDLDTVKLASAHRERAESQREKTNGLWQSWLVSICEGCGTERQPYFKRDRSQVTEKTAAPLDYAQKHTADATKAVAAKPQKPKVAASLVADLSDSAIEQIRRMPRE